MVELHNQKLRDAILKVVKKQLADQDPPETKETFERLQQEGFSAEASMKMIGFVIAAEVFSIYKDDRPYEKERFVRKLKALPHLPWEAKDGENY